MTRKLTTKSYNATGNTYESSSGSDSDESNASLLERNCLLGNKLMLPKDLCENESIFNDFFSRALWDTLPQAVQQKLANLLPVAKDDMSSATKTVHDLLSHGLHRFGKVPIDDFRHKLANGDFRVDIARLQHNLAELTTKDKRMVELQRMSHLAPNVMLSREAVLHMPVRKQRRLVSTGPQSGEQSHLQPRPGLLSSSNGTAGNMFDGAIFNAPKLFLVTEDHYRKLMVQHKKRKMEEPDHPELDLDNIKLKDVPTKPVMNASSLNTIVENAAPTTVEQNSMNCLFSNGTHACFLSVVRDLFCSNPDHRSTLSELQLKLEAWTKSPVAERNVWFEQYRNNGEWNETLHSAVQFLAGEFQNQPEDFVPYIEHKVALNILQWIGASRDADSRLVPLCVYWQSRKQETKPSGLLSLTASNTNTPMCTSSCIGNESSTTPVTASPKSRSRSTAGSKHLLFSPSYSSSSSMSSVSSLPIAGDNSVSLFNDSTVSSLSVKTTTTVSEDDGSTNERLTATPPLLYPTDWTVRKATDEEIQSFREQEKRRYENPHMAFTYKQHSYDSVVGPVKGIYTQAPGISKARGHSMLVANRPNFVTILTLVRDATARLPNGEGTRADICELLKSSQYISPTATDQVLQTIVSGALDRMHTERDPCVKYDAKRKIWIYLHRNRTEEEFERLHMQYQGFTKHKKSIVRKSLRQSKESSTSNTAKQDLLNDSGASVENFTLNSSMIEMDNDTSVTDSAILVSAIVSSAKSTISSPAGASAKSSMDNSRISNSKPILIQPVVTPTSSHMPATGSLIASAKDGIKIGSSVGGTIVSIRQVNSNSGISGVGQKSQILACGQTTSLLSSQSPAQSKGAQLSINNASFASSSGANSLQTMKGGTVITATIGKPIYSSSVGPTPLKQGTSSSSIIQTNLPGTVFTQKMVVSSGRMNTSSSGESNCVPTVVAIKPASSSNMTSATPGIANRVVKPTANLFSTITLAKGQQSVLTPAKQRQIIQNLLSQKQPLTVNQIVSQATILATNTPTITKVQSGDTKQQYKSGPSYVVENQTSVPTFKINQTQASNSTIKALSPKIVKITPTRSKTQTSIRPVGSIGTTVGSSSSTVLPSTSAVNQPATTSMKMIKMNPSTILTSSECHGLLNAVTVSHNVATVTPTTSKSSTMRVLKTAAGATTLIKTEVTRGPSAQQLSQSTSQHALENLRKDSSSSKLVVNSNLNTAQLIPLESLLQKPGIPGTANNSPGGVNTILKLAGTTKTGQQFIQFGTSSNVTSTATLKPTTNVPSSSSSSSSSSGTSTVVGSVAHQYTILPQTRNIISVASTATANRATNLPLTMVSASSESCESTASLLGHVTNSSSAKLMQQGTKVKLLTTTTHNPSAFGSGPAISASSQQGSAFNAKTTVPSTVNLSGEFLNAKIIGVRNIASAKLKGTSSLSTVTKSGPSSAAMVLTRNTGCNSIVLGQQNASNVTVSGASTTVGSMVNGIPGQIQTVLLRNNLIKVQTIPATTANKLSNPQSLASGTVSSSVVNSGLNPTANTLVTTTDRCTTALSKSQLQQQVQHKLPKQQQNSATSGTAVILTPNNVPPSPTIGSAVNEETLSSSYVKIQSSNAEIINNSDAVSQRTQSPRVVISQPIMIPSDIQKSGTSINLKRLKMRSGALVPEIRSPESSMRIRLRPQSIDAILRIHIETELQHLMKDGHRTRRKQFRDR
uniref:Uncharacterized protein n=1 Tax=Anopheles culicifacies TaxID=139723 RepID=A0A182MUG8_9DIPT